MSDIKKAINELRFQLNSKEVKEQHYPVQLSASDAEKILALLKEHETADTGKARIFQCEKCGYGVDDIYLTNEHDFDIYPHFCPNCGKVVKQEAKSTPTAGTNEIPLKW